MPVQLSKQNQRGQMAIFVALIFQVLFVFFAMAINIGLVVHDKINLQNAVDLAAYYAAQRQAEILNVIAHTNYQIRQHWKLLNWRYYVLGTMGYENPPHPAYGNRRTDDPWEPVKDGPVLCVTQKRNWKISGDDNPCKSSSFHVANVPPAQVIAFFNPINALFAAFVQSTRESIANTCNGFAGQNWFYAALIYDSYQRDQRARKELIRALAINLAKNPEDMIDLDGDSILAGAQKTFFKNLTFPNAQGDPKLQLLNPLQGVDPSTWLAEMDIYTTLEYQELKGNGSVCNSVTKVVETVPDDPVAIQELSRLIEDDGSGIAELKNRILQSRSLSAGDLKRMSLGVEKNPWKWVYVGVKASSKPRQLFFPFGEAATFTARAFAQPFGGRIGPWYGRAWARQAPFSSGDKMQAGPQKLLQNGMMNSNNVKDSIPAYSRYPGDNIGLRSHLAQSSLVNQKGIRTELKDYAHLFNGYGPGELNDVVGFGTKPGNNVRSFEIAAAAPDAFDITYYSIQSNFGKRYLPRLRENLSRFGLNEKQFFPRGDLGSREVDNKGIISVEDQIPFTTGNVLQEKDAFWYVRTIAHLLTGWVHNDKYGDYFEFPSERFGVCKEFDTKYELKDMPERTPGSCLQGGRAGYSVKIISPEIFRAALPLGGPGQSEGLIENPPPDDW